MSNKTESTTDIHNLTLGEIINRAKNYEEIVGPLRQLIVESEQSIEDQVSRFEEALEEAERLKAQITKSTKRLERAKQELKEHEEQRAKLSELSTILTNAGIIPAG